MTIIGKIVRRIIAPVVQVCDSCLVRFHITKAKVVIYMDGGLCSQMEMWINGAYYAENGLDVYYDLDWYKNVGVGIDGISLRNYELQILWPGITVRTLSKFDFALRVIG